MNLAPKNLKTSVYLLFFIAMILFYSCKKSFQAEIPSYLHIEKIDLVLTNPALQGTSSHKISDAWVFVDDDLQGVYELPATFPVLKNQKHSLKIKAGIKDNGISATRVEYPFFDFFTLKSFDFYPDSIVTVNPLVTYNSTVDIVWLADFENQVLTIDSAYPSFKKVKITTDTSLVFEGLGSGYVYLDGTKYIFKGVSQSTFNLPSAGEAVYLELNYKTNVNLDVILVSNKTGGVKESFALRLNPTNKSGTPVWNKIYVNLTKAVSGNPDALNYKIAFYSDISRDGFSSGEIYFDNIKLLHL